MRIIKLLFLFVFIYSSHGQDVEYYRVKKNTGKVTITPYDNSNIVMYRLSGLFSNARKVIYLDTINGYQIEIPKNMEIQETNSLNNFCYAIPRNDGRDNAICINSVPKSNFENIDDFKNYFVEDKQYLGENGKSWVWGKNSRLFSLKKEVFDTYDSYKAEIIMNDRKLLGQFIFLESKKSYLWINLVADENTFESDIGNFSKFLKKFKLLE
jgi:hypothetical protein